MQKIDTEKPIYNGLSIRQIINNLPTGFKKSDRNYYIKNCIEVYFNEKNNINKGLNELIKNTNFYLINFFLTAKN